MATTAKKTTARKTPAKKAPAKTTARKAAPRPASTIKKTVTKAGAAPKAAPAPAVGKVTEARENLLALLPFELPKLELPKLELPKLELPKLEDVQSRLGDLVVDLRERTHTEELRKSVENAVEKVRATVGR